MTLGHWKEVTKGGGSLVSSAVRWVHHTRQSGEGEKCAAVRVPTSAIHDYGPSLVFSLDFSRIILIAVAQWIQCCA